MTAKGRYVKIATKFWTDEKTIEFDSKTKLLMLYILTSPHSNMAGYYRLPKAYIKADLQLSDKGLTKGFNKLLGEGLIKYCEKSFVILVPNYYKYNPIQNINQAKGAANRTGELPKNSLVEDYKEAVKAYADKYKEELYKGLPKGFNKQLSKRFDKRLGNTDTDTDTDTDTESSSDKSDTKTDEFSLKKLKNGRYDYPEEYERIYNLYPYQRGNKKAGWRKWAATRRKGANQVDLIEAVKNYAAKCKRENTERKWVMHIKKFFGPDEYWKEYLKGGKNGLSKDSRKEKGRKENKYSKYDKDVIRG